MTNAEKLEVTLKFIVQLEGKLPNVIINHNFEGSTIYLFPEHLTSDLGITYPSPWPKYQNDPIKEMLDAYAFYLACLLNSNRLSEPTK